jgi:hypothetical protein
MKASDGGKIPIVCDTSPCLSTLKGALQTPDLKCAPSCTCQLGNSRQHLLLQLLPRPRLGGNVVPVALVCASICLQ